VARGDTAAFDAVYEQIASSVYGIVWRVIRDPAQSEEVTQDVLLEIWRDASKFDPERGSAMAWVMTRAHRRAVDRAWILTGVEPYFGATDGCGWSDTAYAKWLADLLVSQLLAPGR